MGELLDKTDRAGAFVGEGGFAGPNVAGANEVGEDFVAGLEGGFDASTGRPAWKSAWVMPMESR